MGYHTRRYHEGRREDFYLIQGLYSQGSFTRKDDSLPDKLFERAEISKETIENFLDEYYEIRGWDKNSGVPTKENYVRLGLNDVARELSDLEQQSKNFGSAKI